ncbi:membrane protein [Polaribacter pacificus]|uniref:Membrane protein n=1 Tax=Polaribacter pacificus TaxID=1775173 RepID=A0A917HXK0_9FLAO|nr:ABC transporter permease [Polaribacter pacificus]GGG94728.1 membrane protein [Polaribacter pacificus]
MNFPLYIAKRYLVAKSSKNAINIITVIASFGVIVGTLALFIILSGFSGFRLFTNSMLQSSDPDIKISAVKGKSFLYTDQVSQILKEQPEILASTQVVEERVFLQYKERDHISYIKGVGTNYTDVTRVDSTLSVGQWLDPDFLNSAVIGYGISEKLSMGVLSFGEPLYIRVPKPGTNYITSQRAAFNEVSAQIVGVYSGLEEFANKYVFVDLSLARKLLNYSENQLTAIEVKIKEGVDPENFAEKLQSQLGSSLKVETRIQFNALTYQVLNTESLISYLVFTLIIMIALFNVIGAIIMMIIDKKENLKTLFSLGVTLKEIKRIFVFQGFLLTLFGLSVGLFLGISLVLLQKQFSFFMITTSIPYPVAFNFYNVFLVAITILILGYLAARIASSSISKNFIES